MRITGGWRCRSDSPSSDRICAPDPLLRRFNLKRLKLSGLRRTTLVLGLTISIPGIFAAADVDKAPDLRYVVIVTRHGVRAPTWTAEQLNQYSAEAWPKWDVQPGELTSHGRLLMRLYGAYYRAELARQGLLASSGCANTKNIYIWADTDQRTLESGRALAEGLVPDCDLIVHSVEQVQSDPIFNPLVFQIGRPDRALALSSVVSRIEGKPEALLQLHRPALEQLERILDDHAKAPRSIFDAPMSIRLGEGDDLVDISGPIRTGSTLAENLLLEYADGFRGKNLGWGRLDAKNLRQIMAIHTAYADLARRTSYLARARGSNLLFHVVASLDQAVIGKRVPGALGAPDGRVLLLVGHDTNLSNLSGMLRLRWLLPGYQLNDTPPGGALIFELRKRGQEQFRVRTYYTAQSLNQMRNATTLRLDSPPLRASVVLEGCSTAQGSYDCSWTRFLELARTALDPEFIKP
jgi:4-phytase/acid phosphatase